MHAHEVEATPPLLGKRTALRENRHRWCEITVELSGERDTPRLSITGAEGRIKSARAARSEARQYWESFLEENPEHFARLVRDHRVRSIAGAVALVLREDGEFHGLDVHRRDNDRVYIGESWGQITETLARWWPICKPWLPYHLNDMRAGCEHQRAGGWRSCPGYHKPGEECEAPTLAFPQVRIYRHAAKSFDPPQRFAPGHPLHVKQPRVRVEPHQWAAVPQLMSDDVRPIICPTCRSSAVRAESASPIMSWYESRLVLDPSGTERRCRHDAISVPCPICGYAYGSQWRYETIPAELLSAIRAWVAAR